MTHLTVWFKQRAVSLLLSTLMLLLALAIVWLGEYLQNQPDDTLTIRQVATVSLPPPPPPPSPVVQAIDNSPVLSMQVQGQASVAVNMQIDIPPIELSKPQEMVIDLAPTQWQSLEVNWDAFDLNALDSLPNLLTPLRITLPKSISRQGVNQVLVKLDVMIDESGQVTLIEIASNPYPELTNEIQKLVRSSRFSPPTKDNEPARARFIWPIEISS